MVTAGYILLGIGGFFLGLKTVTLSVEGLFGHRLRGQLRKVNSERIWRTFLLGIIFTGLAQSSSVVTVIGVCLVNAGLLTIADAVALTLGANIGTTVTTQIVSFSLSQVIPWLLGIGVLVLALGIRGSNRVFLAGSALLGLGLLLTGFEFLQFALWNAFKETLFLKSALDWVAQGKARSFLAGMVTTGVLQSSSLVIASTIALLKTEGVPFVAAFFVMLGSNIGTSVTTLIAGIGGTKAGKVAALANLGFNLVSVLMILPVWPLFSLWAQGSSPEPGRQLANAHTIFNLATATILVPVVPVFAGILEKFAKLIDFRKE